MWNVGGRLKNIFNETLLLRKQNTHFNSPIYKFNGSTYNVKQNFETFQTKNHLNNLFFKAFSTTPKKNSIFIPKTNNNKTIVLNLTSPTSIFLQTRLITNQKKKISNKIPYLIIKRTLRSTTKITNQKNTTFKYIVILFLFLLLLYIVIVYNYFQSTKELLQIYPDKLYISPYEYSENSPFAKLNVALEEKARNFFLEMCKEIEECKEKEENEEREKEEKEREKEEKEEKEREEKEKSKQTEEQKTNEINNSNQINSQTNQNNKEIKVDVNNNLNVNNNDNKEQTEKEKDNIKKQMEKEKRAEEREKRYKQKLAEINNDFGVYLAKNRRIPESLEYFCKAVELNPTIALYHFNKGTAHYENETKVDALKSLNSAVKLAPNQLNFKLNRAVVLGQLKKYYFSMQEFYDIVTKDEDNIYGFYNFGIIAFRVKNYKISYTCFKRVSEINPTFGEEVHQFKIHLLNEMGDYENLPYEIINYVANYRPIYMNRGNYLKCLEFTVKLGKSLEDIKNYNDAIDQYELAINLYQELREEIPANLRRNYDVLAHSCAFGLNNCKQKLKERGETLKAGSGNENRNENRSENRNENRNENRSVSRGNRSGSVIGRDYERKASGSGSGKEYEQLLHNEDAMREIFQEYNTDEDGDGDLLEL